MVVPRFLFEALCAFTAHRRHHQCHLKPPRAPCRLWPRHHHPPLSPQLRSMPPTPFEALFKNAVDGPVCQGCKKADWAFEDQLVGLAFTEVSDGSKFEVFSQRLCGMSGAAIPVHGGLFRRNGMQKSFLLILKNWKLLKREMNQAVGKNETAKNGFRVEACGDCCKTGQKISTVVGGAQ